MPQTNDLKGDFVRRKWVWLFRGLLVGVVLSAFQAASGLGQPYYEWATATDEMRGMNIGNAIAPPIIFSILGFLAGIVRDRWTRRRQE